MRVAMKNLMPTELDDPYGQKKGEPLSLKSQQLEKELGTIQAVYTRFTERMQRRVDKEAL